MTKATTSVLGDLHRLYNGTRSKGKSAGILDRPEDGLLEFYAAGYTKRSPRDNLNRQVLHQALYEAAVTLGTEEDMFPFDEHDHEVVLIPEPDNNFDQYALQVVLRANTGPLSNMPGADLGYVPQKISRVLKNNLDMITGGRIYKVRTQWHKKHYTTKIVLAYGDSHFSKTTVDESLNRFADLLVEVR